VNSSKSKLSTGHLLKKLPHASQYWVAFSGGVDSHVLLQLLADARRQLPGSLAAVHVNHQIQQQSGDWEIHCRSVCEELHVPFHLLRVQGRARAGESPEAAARTARYRALADWLPTDAVLTTAQHLDDQAETLLLQLLRGAGPRGLAAMPENSALGCGRLLRPLLEISRKAIVSYAREHRLRWIEDPSNTDTRYDRNLLRQRIMPELQQHWPGLSKVLARAASHQADQVELAQALAVLDYPACCGSDSACLSVSDVQRLSPARQRNLLRYWLERAGLPLPSRVLLERIRAEMLAGRQDASPLVHWPGAEVRRFRDRLYSMTPLPSHDPARRYRWNFREPLSLDHAGGILSATAVTGRGLRIDDSAGTMEIGFRQGGETLQPVGRRHRHRLKKLFQEWGVPDWERDRVPLVYSNGVLIAVAGLCVCKGFQSTSEQAGLDLRWSRMPDEFYR
jgi:tRNA(Ile)-lysidine synthase